MPHHESRGGASDARDRNPRPTPARDHPAPRGHRVRHRPSTSRSSASTAWSHAPGTGYFTEADQARSAIWTGRSSTARVHRRRPPWPLRAPQTSRHCLSRHRGPNSTKPGLFAGGAQRTPRTRFHSDSIPRTPHPSRPSPTAGLSQSPCLRRVMVDVNGDSTFRTSASFRFQISRIKESADQMRVGMLIRFSWPVQVIQQTSGVRSADHVPDHGSESAWTRCTTARPLVVPDAQPPAVCCPRAR